MSTGCSRPDVTAAPSDTHATYNGAPLAGRSVIVTRARAQAGGLAEPLEALGATVIACPVIETVDPEDWAPADAAIGDLEGYDWVVLTSTNGVDRFLERVRSQRGSLAVLGGVSIAAVGAATEGRLREEGIEPDLVPDEFHAESLADAFIEMGAADGWRVLLARALKGRDVLPDALRARGVEVDVVPVYRTIAVEPDREVLDDLRIGRIDAVTFTSPSTAKHFTAAIERAGMDPKRALSHIAVASIGPVTTEALRRLGVEPDIEPAESTMPALAEAIARHFSAGKRSRG